MTDSYQVNRWILLASRIAVGGIFLLAGLDKIEAVGAFADAVRSYHLLPAAFVLPYALVVPPIEILIGAYLLAGFQVRLAALGSILLLGMFIAALGRALILGDTNHPCGCFGEGSAANPVLAFLTGGNTITLWDVIRDLILVALSGLIFARGAGALSAARLFGRGQDALSPHGASPQTERPIDSAPRQRTWPPANQSS